MRRGLAAVAFASVALLALTFGGHVEATGRWERVPEWPLTPREHPLAVWTGSEVVVAGGSISPTHPSASSFAPPPPPLHDAAAYDPRSRSWRRLRPAPVGLDSPGTSTAVVDGVLYVYTPNIRALGRVRPAFLAYSLARDRWRRLGLPPTADAPYEAQLLTAQGRLMTHGRDAAFVYQPHADSWMPMAEGPIPWDKVGRITPVDDRLVVFSCDQQPPADEGPCLVTAASLDLDTGRWERFPRSEIASFVGRWVPAGNRLINPSFGTNHDGRGPYPIGGVLDLDEKRWSALPDPPDHNHWVGGAVLTETEGFYSVEDGWVLDTTRGDRWLRLPELTPGREIGGRTTVSAGRDLYAFGGAEWDLAAFRVRLFGDGWVWRPPA